MNDDNIRKGKPTVEPVVIPEDKKQVLDEVLNSKYSSRKKREAIIRKIGGGFCSVCGKICTHILKYELEGASLIERYCDECISKI